MKRMTRIRWTLAAITAAALTVGGCARTSRSGGARHADVPGMVCPKCETVWTGPQLTGQGTKVQAYKWGREAVCPDCDAMAKSYFENGEKALHDCPTCKVRPQLAEPHRPTRPLGTHI